MRKNSVHALFHTGFETLSCKCRRSSRRFTACNESLQGITLLREMVGFETENRKTEEGFVLIIAKDFRRELFTVYAVSLSLPMSILNFFF